MRPDCAKVPPPAFDDDLGLLQHIEDFTIEQFITQARVEALDVAILPRATRCDVGSPCADRCDPLSHSLGHKLRSIVGPNVARHLKPNSIASVHFGPLASFCQIGVWGLIILITRDVDQPVGRLDLADAWSNALIANLRRDSATLVAIELLHPAHHIANNGGELVRAKWAFVINELGNRRRRR